MDPLGECNVPSIPSRLHKAGRTAALVSSEDKVYIRHEPLTDGYGGQIPGHRIRDQSCNSRDLNSPGGMMIDVLYDTVQGKHYHHFQIATLNVQDIREIKFPHEKVIRMGKPGQESVTEEDTYEFDVIHDPTPCMYPHCFIQLKKNGKVPKDVNKAAKTLLQRLFARLAEKSREESSVAQKADGQLIVEKADACPTLNALTCPPETGTA